MTSSISTNILREFSMFNGLDRCFAIVEKFATVEYLPTHRYVR
ncbi:10119_t:CDS:2 [Funneliformis geosporum]|nr:10119_t:CDS:2 [Funneliformis geosporum]